MSNLNPSSSPSSSTLSPASLNSLREFTYHVSYLPVTATTDRERTEWKSAFDSFKFFLCHGDKGDMNAEAFYQTINQVLTQHRDYSQRRLAYMSVVALDAVLSRFQSRLRDRNESTGEEVVCDDMREIFRVLFEEGHLSIGGEFNDLPCGQFGEFFELMSDWFDNINRDY